MFVVSDDVDVSKAASAGLQGSVLAFMWIIRIVAQNR